MNLNSHIQNLPGSKILLLWNMIGMIFLNVHLSTICIIHLEKKYIFFLWYVTHKEQSPLQQPAGKLSRFKEQPLEKLKKMTKSIKL